jgi:hypothetical protein
MPKSHLQALSTLLTEGKGIGRRNYINAVVVESDGQLKTLSRKFGPACRVSITCVLTVWPKECVEPPLFL